MKIIARHINGITLNPYEFICELNGEVKQFQSDEEAVEYLNENSDVQQDKEAWDEEGIFVLEYDEYFKDTEIEIQK
jgi:hypothetical protein